MCSDTATSEGTARATEAETRPSLRNNPDEILHLVCCRDPEWKVALCGEEGGHINLTGKTLCTMCITVAQERLPSVLENDPPICPMDFRPCPDEHDIDLRILREVSP